MKNISKRIDFSLLLLKTIQEGEYSPGFLQSYCIFITSEDGNIEACEELGILTKTVRGLIEKYSATASLVITNGYIIDTVPLQLSNNEEVWHGYLGVIRREEDRTEFPIKSYLASLSQALQDSAHLPTLQKNQAKEQETNKINRLQIKLLEKLGYEIEWQSLTKCFVDLIPAFFERDNLVCVLFHEENKALLPAAASHQEILENRKDFAIIQEHVVLNSKVEKNLHFSLSGNVYNSGIFYPIINTEYNCLIIALYIPEKVSFEKEVDMFLALLQSFEPLFQKAFENERKWLERKRKDLLVHVTKKFHSSIGMADVLSEIIFAVKEMYPLFEVHLLLSHEWQGSNDLPIKALHYGTDAANGVAEQAYLTGKIQLEDIVEQRNSIIYAPLRGKQGVYGVMEITSPSSVLFPKNEITFIETLADIAGNALENAQLYHQSRKLVHDLQLINETSHQLNSKLKLSDTIHFMTGQIMETFQAEQVGFAMFKLNGEIQVLDGSTEFFKENRVNKFQPLSDRLKKNKEPIYIGDVMKEDDDCHIHPYRCGLVVPMMQANELKGMVVVLHSLPYQFTFENFKLLQSLIHHSTLAFTNAMLHEELEKLVITDYLTRLYARNYLDIRIQELLITDKHGTFILFDIDNFKQINDSYGHQVGDDIIIQVANIMKRNIREQDIAARWGGEELAIYLPQTDLQVGYLVAERILKSVEKETSPNVTVSCGISHWHHRDNDISLNKLFKRADKHLYTAKASGKNQVVMETK